MKKIILPIIISLLLFACQQEPVSEITGQTGTDSLPTTTADTATWHKSNPGIGVILNLFFLDAGKGFCAARTGMYSTSDSGKSWQIIDTSNGAGMDVFFLDQQHGYFVTQKSFGSTADGGATWKTTPLAISNKRHVFFLTPLIGYISTQTSGLFKTIDGGETWKQISGYGSIGGIYFANEQTGWLAIPGIAKTTDGGLHFTDQTPNIVIQAYTIFFTDSIHGWASNSEKYIFKTEDGGNTWNKIIVDKASHDIQFLNNNIGYIPTGDGVSKSMDGGSTWKPILTVEGTGLQEVFFVDENNGWAGDKDGNIYHWSK